MTGERKAKLIIALNALTLIGGAITIFLVLRIIGNAASQSQATNNSIVASQKATEKQLACLATFFSQTDRQNLKISNLDNCQVTHIDTGKTELLPLLPTSSKPSSSPVVPNVDSNKNSTTTNTTKQLEKTQINTSKVSALSQVAPQAKVASPQKQPIRFFWLRFCVPFSQICLRH